MIDASALQMVLAVLTGWLDRQERQALAYLMEENGVLRRHFRRALKEFVDHYHRERNHQGLENRLIDGDAPRRRAGRFRRRPRLGGLLNYYERAA